MTRAGTQSCFDAKLLSPRYMAGIKKTSTSSTFTVAGPGRASTVSQVIHRCSSWSRTTTQSPAARKIVFDDDAGFHLLRHHSPSRVADPGSLTSAGNEGAGGAVGERAHFNAEPYVRFPT